ncbi:MAG: spore photoproduct lyase family protein, partial [Actinomycetota bacterium]
MGADPVDGTGADLHRLLDVRTIYLQPAVLDLLTGRQVLDRFPHAERIEVEGHQGIAGLHGNEGNAERWMAV